jgi:hypothetical protein
LAAARIDDRGLPIADALVALTIPVLMSLVGTSMYCSPRQTTHFESSFLEYTETWHPVTYE